MSQTAVQHPNYKWIALGVTATGTMLATMDFSIVLIMLPTLTSVFETETTTVVWVSLAFQLVTLGLVLPAGRFGDLFGKRRVFATGMLVYAAGMLLAGFAPGVIELVAARIVQGGGGALTNALSSAIVTAAFPRHERGKALGILMSAAGTGMMLGPPVGGFLLETFGWRSIFFARVPLALAAFGLALVFLQKDSDRGDEPRERFDVPGSVVLFFMATSFALGVNRGSSEGFTSLPFLVFTSVFTVLAIWFVTMEMRIQSPVIDLRLFARRAFAIGSGLMLVATMAVVSLSFLMPFYLMLGKAMSPGTAGLVLLAGPSVTIVTAPIAGRLSDSFGPRVLTPIGLGMTAAAFLTIASLSADGSILIILPLLALSAAGSSIFNTPNQSAIMGAAPAGRIGTVSALVPTLRSIGLIVGIATAEAVYVAIAGDAGSATDGLALTAAERGAVVDAVNTGLRVFGSIAAVGVVVALLRGEDPHLRRHA